MNGKAESDSANNSVPRGSWAHAIFIYQSILRKKPWGGKGKDFRNGYLTYRKGVMHLALSHLRLRNLLTLFRLGFFGRPWTGGGGGGVASTPPLRCDVT